MAGTHRPAQHRPDAPPGTLASDRTWWAHVLRSSAGPAHATIEGLRAVPETMRREYVERFADAWSNRLRTDMAVLARVLAFTHSAARDIEPADDRAGLAWHQLWSRVPTNKADALRPMPGDGPCTPGVQYLAIEDWTQTELAVLHAAWDRARESRDAELTQRCLQAARWHVREVQPDNGTNLPWAAHVFAELAMRDGDAAAALHAQTLAHNALAAGLADVRSAAILIDAADVLERG